MRSCKWIEENLIKEDLEWIFQSIQLKVKKKISSSFYLKSERKANWVFRILIDESNRIRPTSVWLKLRIGNGRQFGKPVKKESPRISCMNWKIRWNYYLPKAFDERFIKVILHPLQIDEWQIDWKNKLARLWTSTWKIELDRLTYSCFWLVLENIMVDKISWHSNMILSILLVKSEGVFL